MVEDAFAIDWERIDAMAVFKEFVGTAQREFVAAERQKNPAAVEFRVGGTIGAVGWLCGMGVLWHRACWAG